MKKRCSNCNAYSPDIYRERAGICDKKSTRVKEGGRCDKFEQKKINPAVIAQMMNGCATDICCY